MKTKKDYNYKQLTVTFDLDFADDRELFEWLEKHRDKRNGFNAQIKKAIKAAIEQEKLSA